MPTAGIGLIWHDQNGELPAANVFHKRPYAPFLTGNWCYGKWGGGPSMILQCARYGQHPLALLIACLDRDPAGVAIRQLVSSNLRRSLGGCAPGGL